MCEVAYGMAIRVKMVRDRLMTGEKHVNDENHNSDEHSENSGADSSSANPEQSANNQLPRPPQLMGAQSPFGTIKTPLQGTPVMPALTTPLTPAAQRPATATLPGVPRPPALQSVKIDQMESEPSSSAPGPSPAPSFSMQEPRFSVPTEAPVAMPAPQPEPPAESLEAIPTAAPVAMPAPQPEPPADTLEAVPTEAPVAMPAAQPEPPAESLEAVPTAAPVVMPAPQPESPADTLEAIPTEAPVAMPAAQPEPPAESLEAIPTAAPVAMPAPAASDVPETQEKTITAEINQGTVDEVDTICVDVVQRGENYVTLYFYSGEQFHYSAGQHVHIDPTQFAELTDWQAYIAHHSNAGENQPAYVITSVPNEECLSITVRRESYHPTSGSTPSLLNSLLVSGALKGRPVRLNRFGGRQTLSPDYGESTDCVVHCISNGGAVLSYALLKEALQSNANQHVKHILLRTGDASTEHVFAEQLHTLAGLYPSRVTLKPDSAKQTQEDSAVSPQLTVSEETLREVILDPTRTLILVNQHADNEVIRNAPGDLAGTSLEETVRQYAATVGMNAQQVIVQAF